MSVIITERRTAKRRRRDHVLVEQFAARYAALLVFACVLAYVLGFASAAWEAGK